MSPCRLAVLLVAVVAAAAPASARAQAVLTDLSGATRIEREVAVEASISGRLTIEFHGDQAAGCAARDLCDSSGTIVWRPPQEAVLFRVDFVAHHRHRTEGFLFLFDFDPQSDSGVRAVVDRGSRGSCADARATEEEALSRLAWSRRSLALRLPGPDADPVTTRCAGPLPADIADAVTLRRFASAAVEPGNVPLDLSGVGAFSGHGLAGTVSSSIRVDLGPAHVQAVRNATPRSRRRVHYAELDYSVESVAGRIAVPFSASSDADLCAALDACGLGGTETLFPAAHSGSAELVAFSERARPRRDLLAALGVGRSGDPRGVEVYGAVEWPPGDGTATESVERSGAPDCSDDAPLQPEGLDLVHRGNRIDAFFAALGDVTGGSSVRTRCPGPLLTDVAGDEALATGSLPLAAFARPTVAIHLTRGASAAGPLYSGRSQPDMTVILRRRGAVKVESTDAGSRFTTLRSWLATHR